MPSQIIGGRVKLALLTFETPSKEIGQSGLGQSSKNSGSLSGRCTELMRWGRKPRVMKHT